MNYKEKYEKAIVHLKKFLVGDCVIDQDILDDFPELKESEDERIRKYLIEELKVAKSVGELKFAIPQPTREECISYLERQKEPKQDSITKYVYSKEDKKFIQDCANILVANDFATSAERLLSMFEQKPAEWSDKDKNIFNLALDLIKHSDDCSGILDKELEVKWFAELPSRFVPQPKQELDEESKKVILKAVAFLNSYGNSLYNESLEKESNAVYKVADSLKLLNTQPKPEWKPSEQEKGALRTAVYVLTEERNFPKAASHLQAILDVFEGKESRKDWKPSEEQMEELYNTFYTHSVNAKSRDALESLYNQLKKL